MDLTCGVDGSVYKKHPSFARMLRAKVKLLNNKNSLINLYHKTNELVGFGIHVTFILSHDGSGKGAALVSAVTGRLNEPEIAYWTKIMKISASDATFI